VHCKILAQYVDDQIIIRPKLLSICESFQVGIERAGQGYSRHGFENNYPSTKLNTGIFDAIVWLQHIERNRISKTETRIERESCFNFQISSRIISGARH